MGFQDNFPGVHNRVFAQLWPLGTYSPVTGDDVSCRVNLEHDVLLQPSGYDVQIVETGSTIEALYDDVGEPAQGSTFVIDGTTWEVVRITDNDRTTVRMVVIES